MKKSRPKISIRSILDDIRKLLSFAEDQILSIEAYYNTNAQDRTVRSPMNIVLNYPGTTEEPREAHCLHQNAYILGHDIYFYLIKEFRDVDKVLDKLLMVKSIVLANEFCAMSFADQRLSQAREREEHAVVRPVADIFYFPYQGFIRNLDISIHRLSHMQIDEKDWDNQIRLIFTNHARKLIHEAKMTPKLFQKVVDETSVLDVDEKCSASFEYIYHLSKFFSLVAGPTSIDFKNGKPVFHTPYLSGDKLAETLNQYFCAKVKHPTMLAIFHEIFNQCYLEEVELPRQQRALSRKICTEGQRWNSQQFWTATQKEHSEKMGSVFSELLEQFKLAP